MNFIDSIRNSYSASFLDSLLSWFQNGFRFSDVLDVVIVASLVYIAIFLFKQTRSLRILAGIGILLLLYIAAGILTLSLTTAFLQYFFGFFLVIFVVVFQEELRRFLELIALVSTRQRSSRPIKVSSPASDAILQAVAYFVHNKIGALIVLSGEERFERYLEGGEMLDGIISEDVLMSIFDPTSPGHDGAMIINKNRIERFGAHLPLSNNFREIGKHGTRHSAALGLAERTDAFIIVVSEEKGTISVAYKSKLRELKSIEELEMLLTKFLKDTFAEDTYSSWQELLFENTWEKFASVGVALLLKILA